MVVKPVHAKSTSNCPDTDELALLQQWHALHSGVRRLTDGLSADVEAEQGLAPSSFQALMFLVTAPGQAAPMNRLSAALGFSTAGTTKVVDRLAEAGLVERRPSDSDRRVVYTALTSAGAETVLAASRSLARALRARVVDPLGEDLFRTLATAVGSLDPGAGGC
jgi:DNA-binding MarR family transcriptional regulator